MHAHRMRCAAYLLTLGYVLDLCGCAGSMSGPLFALRAPKNAASSEKTQGCHLERFSDQAMGTLVTFLAWTDEAASVQAAFRRAMQEIVRIEHLMTTWSHPGWPPSEIMQLNDQAGSKPLPVSADTFAVLESARCMAQKSGGLFDATIGAFDGLWRFDENLVAEIPEPAAIAERLKSVDSRDLILDRRRQTAFLARAGMRLNLGGIAKGYAVDRAVDVLHAAGVNNVIVQAGGDLYASGQRGSKPWRVGIRDPRGLLVEDVLAHVVVGDQAVSTAGDYERGFDVQGHRYHHILDPRTGQPSALSQSVTIIAPSAWLADAIDDVVFLQGPEVGLRWIKQFAGVEAVVVDNMGKLFVSEGLKEKLVYDGATRGQLQQRQADAP